MCDEELILLCREVISEAIELDLGSLSAFDPAAAATRDDALCKAQATALTQALFNALLVLPGDNGPTGRSVTLPASTALLPRAKPLPKPRLPTKWEQFAHKKGIRKRKRSSLAFDEKEQKWKRRYGYKRANAGDVVEPVIAAKPSDEVSTCQLARYECRPKLAANYDVYISLNVSS